MITDLANLLHPHDPALLRRAIADGTRLHLHTDRAAEFQALLRWSEVGEFVEFDRVSSGRTRVLVNGRDLPLEMFTRLDWDKRRRETRVMVFQTLCDKGASLVVNQIDKSVRSIAATTAMVQRELEVASGVNAYVSFRRNSAFPPHWDGHNVLLLQLYGRKHWKCYGQRERAAADGNKLTADEAGEPEWEAELVPGDILYLPRGMIHSGAVTDAHSLHLTIRISPLRGTDFVAWLARRANDSELFRSDLTGLGEPASRAAQRDVLRKALHDLVDGAELEDFLGDPALHPAPYRPMNLGLEDPLLPDIWIKPALRRTVALPAEGDFKFESSEVSVDLSADECAVLRLLLERHAVQFRDLAALVPGLAPQAIADATARLARKSMIFLLD